MKRVVILALGLALTGCGAIPGSATTTPASTDTPVVLIQTVLVTVIPTQLPAPAPTFTLIPPPSPTTELTAAASPTGGASGTSTVAAATATLPFNAGGDLFTNLTRSSDHVALRCQPDTITFGVSTTNVSVASVDIYYRIEDQLSTAISNWHNGGTFASDKHGNFSMDFAAAAVDPDLRSHRAWLDYQFVGINKLGEAVGRSARIVKQITYTIDCSD